MNQSVAPPPIPALSTQETAPQSQLAAPSAPPDVGLEHQKKVSHIKLPC